MNLLKRAHAPFVAAALILPALAFGNAPWHSASGEAGDSFHVEHLKSTKTRAEVAADVVSARRDGTLEMYQRNTPVPANAIGSAKTRQQVIDEMRNETQADRRARMELQWGG